MSCRMCLRNCMEIGHWCVIINFVVWAYAENIFRKTSEPIFMTLITVYEEYITAPDVDFIVLIFTEQYLFFLIEPSNNIFNIYLKNIYVHKTSCFWSGLVGVWLSLAKRCSTLRGIWRSRHLKKRLAELSNCFTTSPQISMCLSCQERVEGMGSQPAPAECYYEQFLIHRMYVKRVIK